MNNTLLKQLIDLGDAFETEFTTPAEQTLPNFLAWAGRANVPGPPLNPDLTAILTHQRTYTLPDLPVLPSVVAHYLCLAYRYHRAHVKKALHNTPLLTYDDFIYLLLLELTGSMTKMHLVESTVNEKASGMLVIKRLLDNEFVIQTPDPTDQRARRISITEAGRAVLAQVIPAMQQTLSLLVGDVPEAGQQQLANLLMHLDAFHKPLFLHEKETPLSRLLEQMGDEKKR